MSLDIEITDHAVVRWLQRVEGVNIRAVRREIRKNVQMAVQYEAPITRVNGVQFRIDYTQPGKAIVVTTWSLQSRAHLAVSGKVEQ